jgi:hypothetical protein
MISMYGDVEDARHGLAGPGSVFLITRSSAPPSFIVHMPYGACLPTCEPRLERRLDRFAFCKGGIGMGVEKER